MKRYNVELRWVELFIGRPIYRMEFSEAETGRWVEYAEVEVELTSLRQDSERLKLLLEAAEKERE